MYAIAEMLGIPRSDRSDFRRWSDAIIEAGGGRRSPATDAALEELLGYFPGGAARAAARRAGEAVHRAPEAQHLLHRVGQKTGVREQPTSSTCRFSFSTDTD